MAKMVQIKGYTNHSKLQIKSKLTMRTIRICEVIGSNWLNSQADDCADLQIRSVFRYFRNEEVSLAIFNHQTTSLKFHENADFHSFRANKSTEQENVLSLSLSGKVLQIQKFI